MLDLLSPLAFVAAGLLVLVLLLTWLLYRVSRRVRAFERDVATLRSAANQASRAEAQEASLDRLLVDLTRLTERLRDARDAREIPQLVVHIVQRTFDADQVVVLFARRPAETQGKSPTLVVAASSSGSLERALNREIGFGEGELGLVADLQEAVDRQDLDGRRIPGHTTVPGLRSFRTDLAVPMVVAGQTFGVVAVSGLGRHYRREKTMLSLIAQTAGFGLQSAASYSALKAKADLDGLTRILNRRAVDYRLGELVFEAERSGREVGVVLLDVDHFKPYNDNNGHAAGDRALQDLAALVNESLRAEDVFGRFGGEEFVVVAPNQSVASTYGLAEKLRSKIEAHDFEYAVDQPLGRVTVSGGIAVFPHHGRDSTDLLQSADQALYKAKQAGRNRIEISPAQAAGGS